VIHPCCENMCWRDRVVTSTHCQLILLAQSAFGRQSLVVVAVSGERGAASVDAYQLTGLSCVGEEVLLRPVMVMSASGLHSISRHLGQYAVWLRLTASFPVFLTLQSKGEILCCE